MAEIEFDTMPASPLDPASRRFTAPVAGRYACTQALTLGPVQAVRVEVNNAGKLLDIEALRASVGRRVRLNGPRPLTGTLRSFEHDADDDFARLTIETGDGDA